MTKTARTQNVYVHKRRAELIGSWVKPGVKKMYQEIADREKITLSALTAKCLEEYLANRLAIEHTSTLEPAFKGIVNRRFIRLEQRQRFYFKQLARLLLRSAYSSEHTRNISTNILYRQDGIKEKPETIDHILDEAEKSALAKITTLTPELQKIANEIDKWFPEEIPGETDAEIDVKDGKTPIKQIN